MLGSSSPPGLTVSLGPNGLTVTIRAGSTPGTYTVPYTIIDRDGKTASSTITVSVDYPFNNPPVANPDTFPVFLTETELLNVLANDTDIEGGNLELVSVTQPASGGTVEKVGQQVRFTATGAANTSVVFTYTVRDAGLPRKDTTGTVTVNISPCREASPLLTNDQFFAPPGGRSIPIDIFANDSSTVGNLVVGPVSAGSLVGAGGAGRYTYTAPVGFNDNATFSYTVTNVCGVPANATVTIDVNRRPTANADAALTPRNRAVVVPVLANDVDPDLPNDVLTVVLVPGSATNRARVTVVDGGVRFDPDRRFSGNASFQYYVQDSGGLTSNPVTVTVSVGVNSPPVAGNFAVSTVQRRGGDLLQRVPAAHRRSRRGRSRPAAMSLSRAGSAWPAVRARP